ncbi:GroES-like protein [Corynespora cassiicola Philippines]|uniref:GroES-like protein n=1 Tax=Corynespora cassiicola Philippines TaxID=1448308 RepID=A0A2T2N824_CORCC|nr:GroES-like protein [Corynespora cassiicola Philippines]
MSLPLPTTHRAVFLSGVGEPLQVKTLPTPQPGPGSAVIRILAATVRANAPEVFRNANSGHQLPVPFVPGFIAIGRIAAIGPDGTALIPDQLVLFDPFIQGRDSPEARYISGFMQGFNDESRKLSLEWRNSTYAEYARVPLENCYLLDESRLFNRVEAGGLGYSLDDLTHIFSMLIPFGGLTDIDVKAGDTIIIAPATGRYGSAAAHVALALGASVIAIGRNDTVLSQIEGVSPRLTAVCLTGDVDKDTASLKAAAVRGVDAFWDMSPSAAGSSTHFRSCLNVLNSGARISFMGVAAGVNIEYMDIVGRGLSIKGTWMCTKEQGKRLINMVESGVLPLGARAGMGPVQTFKIEQCEEALNAASGNRAPGEIVLIP